MVGKCFLSPCQGVINNRLPATGSTEASQGAARGRGRSPAWQPGELCSRPSSATLLGNLHVPPALSWSPLMLVKGRSLPTSRLWASVSLGGSWAASPTGGEGLPAPQGGGASMVRMSIWALLSRAQVTWHGQTQPRLRRAQLLGEPDPNTVECRPGAHRAVGTQGRTVC